MRNLAVQASGLALMVAFSALVGATPASAAPGVGVVELSDDGVNFARSYPGVVFDDIAHLSPGDNQSETVYVRNTGTKAGYLLITMRDVSYSDEHYGDALSVTTSTPDNTGNAKALSSAAPCNVTLEGTLVEPGETVPVLATLALGDLSGSEGQGATASFTLRFALSDMDPGKLPATNCGNSGTTIPGTPTNTDAPGRTDSPSTVSGSIIAQALGSGPTSSTTAAAGTQTPAGTETAADTETALPTIAAAFSLDPNTWRLYQEYLLLILVLAAIVGAGISWIVGRRKHKDAEDV